MQEAPEIGEHEQQLYLSRQNELRSGIEIKQEQINQRVNELKELNVRLDELNKTYALFQKEIALLKPLVEKGAIAEMEILQTERKASEMPARSKRRGRPFPGSVPRSEKARWR